MFPVAHRLTLPMEANVLVEKLKVYGIMLDDVRIDGRFDDAVGLHFVNLTQLHRASGESHNRCPAMWLRTARAKQVVTTVAHVNGIGDNHIVIVTPTSTECEAIVALAYAMWLSPEFYAKAAVAFRQLFSQ